MLILIVLWWICAQLAAPTWCFVCIGFGMFVRFLGSIIDICKVIAALAER